MEFKVNKSPFELVTDFVNTCGIQPVTSCANKNQRQPKRGNLHHISYVKFYLVCKYLILAKRTFRLHLIGGFLLKVLSSKGSYQKTFCKKISSCSRTEPSAILQKIFWESVQNSFFQKQSAGDVCKKVVPINFKKFHQKKPVLVYLL